MHRVRLVLSGHDHTYQRFAPIDGIHYVIAGAGGKSIYEIEQVPGLVASARVDGFVLVDANGAAMTLQAIDTTGRELDRVTIER